MIKYPVVLLLSVFICWGIKIKVVQCTSQEWIGGLQETGYGTDYRLTIKVRTDSDQLQIEDLWVGNYHMKIRLMADPANPPTKTFKKGSQVTCKAGIIFRPGADERSSLTGAGQLEKPFNFTGEGLLGYTYKGHKAYLEIAKFKKLKKLIFP